MTTVADHPGRGHDSCSVWASRIYCAGWSAYLEADYRRWAEFDKTPRVAAHSADGVIELMPIADASLYSFKYVNGHPKNHRLGLPTVMAFGVLADVATGAPVLLSELTLTTAMRTAATSVMVAGQPGPARQPRDGLDRQWRPERVPGAGLPPPAGHPRAAPVRHRPRRHRQAHAPPGQGTPGLTLTACASTA